ncbi:hypothetical protein [Gynuella sunshinyii]|uniref:Uncharacterized protein n=1 Tax=Gynuella sunshinyii YC6258 TaxID=1445510 RepID=A0A0C5VJG9_9GAMM|nr:hypothetical protein [Gynuella sunshinyii]AJQ94772.1 hypothetical Protein YC6258_02734 [Gynuella sunshinyii YC6258]
MNIVRKYIGFLKWFYKYLTSANGRYATGPRVSHGAVNMEYSVYNYWADKDSTRLYSVLLSLENYLESNDDSKDIEELIKPCLDFGPTLKLSSIPLYTPIAISIAISAPLFFITELFLPAPVATLLFVFPFMLPAMFSFLELRKIQGLISEVSHSLVEYDKAKDSNLNPLSSAQSAMLMQWLKYSFKFFSRHKHVQVSQLFSGKTTLNSKERKFYAFHIEILERYQDKDGKDCFKTIDSFFGIRLLGFNITEMRICTLKQNEDGLQPWTSLSPEFNERYCCEVADPVAAAKWLTPLTLEEILDADRKLGALQIMTSKDGYLLTLFKTNIFAQKQNISTTLKTPSAFLNDLLTSDQSPRNLPIALSLIDTMVSQ